MKDEKKQSSKWLIPTSLVLIFVAIIALLLYLLNGQTTVEGDFDERKDITTLTCESDVASYSKFKYDNSDSKNLKINAIFNGKQLNSISLIYRLKYHDDKTLYLSESINHAEMNQNFDKDGMAPDSLTAKYSVTSNSIQLSIFAKNEDINEKTLRYFMINNVYDIKKLTTEEMTKYYNEKGLDCIIKHNKTEEEVNSDQ